MATKREKLIAKYGRTDDFQKKTKIAEYLESKGYDGDEDRSRITQRDMAQIRNIIING